MDGERVGTIARQLHVHRDVVHRVLAGNCAPVHPSPLRPSRIDPYRLSIKQTLVKFPTLTAARLHAMVSERGFVGCTSHLRAVVAGLRPRRGEFRCQPSRSPSICPTPPNGINNLGQ